jgi:hypothetical protein
VFRSTDNGLSFANFNFTNSTTPLLYVNYNNTLAIFAGTTGSATGGVWKYIEGIIQSAPEENENVSEYKLFQNYPNPFNPVTVIRFSIPSDINRESLTSRSGSIVKLIVYDALGREVKTLVNETNFRKLSNKFGW